MTNIEKIQKMSIDELATWLDINGNFDNSPWMEWWNNTFCKNCPTEIAYSQDTRRPLECSWCELHSKCKFFTDLEDIPDNKSIIRMWLNEGV